MSVSAGEEVRTGKGIALRLGALIKSGGAGSVFRLQQLPLQVAKVYHHDVDHALYERKLTAMLALSPDLPDLIVNGRRHVQIAWPQDLLRDRAGRFLGFVMPAVDVKATSELECILQERQARSLGLPTGLGAKVTLAANLAAVIAALHRQGHHVVDMKPVNLRFYPESLYMAMLDCDGFSVRGRSERFHAPQFTIDYLAPEFHAAGLNDSGEETQDRFALAVVIFQLLNFGIHPYTGRPLTERVPTDIPGRIAQRCYPYGLRPHAQLAPNPVSSHATMPADLREMFDRAFEGPGQGRPSAQQWAELLKTYALRSGQRLAICKRDTDHQHFSGRDCAACERADLLARTARGADAARRSIQQTGVATRAAAPPAPTGTRWRQPAAAPATAGTRWRRPAIPAPKSAVPIGRMGRGPVRVARQPSQYSLGTPPTPPPPMPSAARQHLQRVTQRHKVFSQAGNVIAVAFFLSLSVVFTNWIKNSEDSSRRAQGDTSGLQVPPPIEVAPTPVWDLSSPELSDYTIRFHRGEASKAIGTAAAAMTNGDTLSYQHSLRQLRSAARKNPDPARGSQEREIRVIARYADANAFATPAERDAELLRLGGVLEADYRDAEAAFGMGWLMLEQGHRDLASQHFVHALWLDPDFAAAWYGWGLTAVKDGEFVGALAIAEALPKKDAALEFLRPRFEALAVGPVGEDPRRYERIGARARRIAAGITGMPIEDELVRTSHLPLPARPN